MRILWHSNWIRSQTGYGKQTRQVVTRLARLGHQVVVSATHGIQGHGIEVEGIPHLPGVLSRRDMGQQALVMHVQNLKPDMVVTLADIWPMPENLGELIRGAGAVWIPWTPVDHDPCPPAVAARLRHADRALAMSRFGQRKMAELGIGADFIPHGVETSVFCPGDRREAKRALGFPEDHFMVAMVQANRGYPSRKCFQQQLDGFARFHARHPASLLYLHCWEGPDFEGVNLPALATALGIRDAVICLDRYRAFVGVPETELATIYRAADVTLNATAGEGFGVPIIESLACGTPVIVTDFSAMSELCPDGVGWRTRPLDRFFTYLESFQVWPDPAQIAEALEDAYQADREGMREACVDFARQFDADRLVTERWVPLLDELKARQEDRFVDIG